MIFECTGIAKSVRDVELKEKGSKFIGFAFPVKDEEDVKKKLESVRSEHPSATHHCYAWRLGFSGNKYRLSDDGEPSGTAGLPIYNQLLSKDLTYTLLIVVRYYGGTKLGVSGLIKAYKQCAVETLSEVKTITLEKKEKLTIIFPYSSQSEAMRLIEKYRGELLTQTYMEDCELEIEIPKKELDNFQEHLKAHAEIEIWENQN